MLGKLAVRDGGFGSGVLPRKRSPGIDTAAAVERWMTANRQRLLVEAKERQGLRRARHGKQVFHRRDRRTRARYPRRDDRGFSMPREKRLGLTAFRCPLNTGSRRQYSLSSAWLFRPALAGERPDRPVPNAWISIGRRLASTQGGDGSGTIPGDKFSVLATESHAIRVVRRASLKLVIAIIDHNRWRDAP